MDEIVQALADDLNTHAALGRLDHLANHAMGTELAANLVFLGLFSFEELEARVAQLQSGKDGLAPLAERLGQVRAAAMASKDFSEVDRLKSALLEAGVEVRMSKEGVELVPGPNFDPSRLEGLS